MDQEKFVGKYIEILNATLSEAIQKNVVGQAQRSVIESEMSELVQQIETLKTELSTTRQQLNLSNANMHEANVARQHFETFKNELAISRKEIEDLKVLIAEKDKELSKYKPAPAPVVINKLGKKNTPTTEAKVVKVKTVKDAGSF